MERFTISLDRRLAREFDQLIRAKGYGNRSEAVRDMLRDKLDNLFAFYEQVQNRVGWNRYTTLDLRYKGQVVASPKLSWKVPVDRALSNINWLQAVMDNAPKQDLPGGDAAANNDQFSGAGSTREGPDPPKPASPSATPPKHP